MTAIFISYRRDDASANAGRLCDWLRRQFKAENVFLDVDRIAPGDDFPKVLKEKLATTDVLVAVVGKAWATLCDAAGNRRIAKADESFSRDQLEETEKLRQVGRASQADVGNFRVRMLAAQTSVSQGQGRRDTGRVVLAELMGLPERIT